MRAYLFRAYSSSILAPWLLAPCLFLAACGSDPPGVIEGIAGAPGGGGASGEGGAGAAPDGGASDAVPVPSIGPRGLHAVGNHIEDDQGKTIVLRGVNRSGTEYMCIQGVGGRGFFDGPSDAASIAAIVSWKANAVRIPLNETCWLAINGAPAAYAGEAYKAAIRNYVALLHAQGLVPILDLHWSAPGTLQALRLQPMPDADHATAFWTDVAATFANDDGVIFEPFNEPYPSNNQDSAAAWACWRDGCTATVAPRNSVPPTYQAVGMQALVTAIRAAGARNLILLGGVQFSNALTQWLAYKPVDPLGNLGATWHAYNFNACITQDCWDGAPGAVAAAVPLVATEFGERDCASTFVVPLMQWFDTHVAGYLAWSWDAYGVCTPYVSATAPGNPFSLIGAASGDYSGTPNIGYGQAIFDHLTAF
jgi:endoglucanase